MTVGNVLGLLQHNVKRVLAYSSIAHSGYMLVGLTALARRRRRRPAPDRRQSHAAPALQGVLFYLAAYGIMNAGAFGVLMLLPAAPSEPTAAATAAPSMPDPARDHRRDDEDIAGQGRRHPMLGLAWRCAASA